MTLHVDLHVPVGLLGAVAILGTGVCCNVWPRSKY